MSLRSVKALQDYFPSSERDFIVDAVRRRAFVLCQNMEAVFLDPLVGVIEHNIEARSLGAPLLGPRAPSEARTSE